MCDAIIRQDEADKSSYRPMVAIGHSKDLVDFETVESFLFFLKKNGITVSTMASAYERCNA